MNPYHPQPIVVPPDAGKVLEFLGVTHKLTGQHTGGAYYLFEFEFDPESGNRLHVHQHEDEVVHVLEGAIEIRLGDQILQRSRRRRGAPAETDSARALQSLEEAVTISGDRCPWRDGELLR
jgi:hypothetical protein